MKKYGVFLGGFLMLLLAGCDTIEHADTTMIDVDRNGSVVQIVVEPFSEGEEEAKGLKTMIKSSIEKYNQAVDSEKVVLADLDFSDGQVKMVLNYETCSDYAAFNNVTFFRGTVEEAVVELYPFDDIFHNTKDETITGEELQKKYTESDVLILEEPGQVRIPGKIQYVSSDVKILSEDLAEVPASENSGNSCVTQKEVYVIYD